MFDWDNLEDTMVKQKYIDSLREELEYLKDPTKKRKGKKKTVKKENLKVSIYKPQISKNTILKEQLMTEKCVRLWNDPEADISNIKLDKLHKGMFNKSNNCFMNVILQSLYSIPVFYNFLYHFMHQIEQNPKLKEIFDSNSDDSLLIANFLELTKYFDPVTGTSDSLLTYGAKIINVEGIFHTLLMNFNPDKMQQDCHEFLSLMLDTLNCELFEILEKSGISTSSESLKSTSSSNVVDDEWEEIGKKKLKIHNKAEDLIKNSPIFEIFGGWMREDISAEGKKSNSARLQPYLYLSLGITMDCSIDSSLEEYFQPETLEDYKVGQKKVKAIKTHCLLTVPNILILQIKRFLYTDRPIKSWEMVSYPDILELKDEYFTPEIQVERKKARKATDDTAKKEKKDVKPVAKPSTAQPKTTKKKTKSSAANNEEVKVEIHEQTEEQKQELSAFKSLEKYELIGVIVHKGKDVGKGHYIAFSQDNYGNWMLYDDKEYKQVSPTIVLDQQAYVLIYRKFT